MRLNKVILENWGVYVGRQEIDMSCPESSPIVLIYGENGLGKTTLFSSLRWALYNHEVQEKSAEDYASWFVARDGDPFPVSVTVHLEHDKQKVVLKRGFTANPLRKGDNRVTSSEHYVTLKIGNTPIGQADIPERVKILLPEDLASFFLFDGEELERIIGAINHPETHGLLVKQKIEHLLGIPALIDSSDSLKAQRRVLENKIKSDQKQANDFANLNLKLSELDSKIGRTESEFGKFTKEVDDLTREKNDLTERLKNSDATRAKATELAILEEKAEEVKGLIDSRKEHSCEQHDRFWFLPVETYVSDKANSFEEIRSKVQSDKKREWDLEKKILTLENSLKSHICESCGQSIEVDTERVQQDLAQANEDLSLLQKTMIAGEFQSEDRILASWHRAFANAFDLVAGEDAEIGSLAIDLASYSQKIRGIQRELLGTNSESALKIAEDYDLVHRKLDEAAKSLGRIGPALNDLRKERDRTALKMVQSPGVSPENKRRHLVLDQIIDVLDSTVEHFRDDVRIRVESEASRNYLAMETRKTITGLRVTENYEVQIVSTSGDRLDGSKGQKLTYIYALIGACISVSGNQSFWMVDTPAGRIDALRNQRLWEWIAMQDRQVIILPHSKELTPQEAHEFIGNRIGRELELVETNVDLHHEIRPYRK